MYAYFASFEYQTSSGVHKGGYLFNMDYKILSPAQYIEVKNKLFTGADIEDKYRSCFVITNLSYLGKSK